MPTYQTTLRAENMSSVRNYYALTINECIDRLLVVEGEDWIGEIESITLVEVKIKWP